MSEFIPTNGQAIPGRKKIRGVAINDSKEPVSIYINKKQVWMCPFYTKWRDMICRCYNLKFQMEHTTYHGCTVSDEWLIFSNFKAWMKNQDWQGNELDKDIIKPGNKIYAPEFCSFVDAMTNSFINDQKRKRGNFKIGVSWDKRTRAFKAACSDPFGVLSEFIGYFADEESAHEAWRKRKHSISIKIAEMQSDLRVSEALKIKYENKEIRPLDCLSGVYCTVRGQSSKN